MSAAPGNGERLPRLPEDSPSAGVQGGETSPVSHGRPRLVATDLDNTLLDADGTVSQRTRTALDATQRAGIEVVFVTGRPQRWVEPVADEVGRHGLTVCANGAVVLDLATGETVLARTIDADTVLELSRRLREVLPGLRFGVESGRWPGFEPEFVPATPPPTPPRIAALVDLLDPAPVKLLARDGMHSSDQLLAAAGPLCEGLAEPTHSGADGLLEISALGASKASALAWVADQHEVDAADVWAFGDSPNDLPMLAWAGRSYAVANAHPDVLAAASYHCLANTEDGVARVLEDMLD